MFSHTMGGLCGAMDFPKASEDTLGDLDTWLKEFDRVVAHVSGNCGLIPEDRITHLLSCWSSETDAGENMRPDQQSDVHLEAESAGRMAECWQMLLARLLPCRACSGSAACGGVVERVAMA